VHKFLLLSMGFVAVAAADVLSAEHGWLWRGQMPPGQAIEIRAVTGDIYAAPSGSGEVEISARLSRDEGEEAVEMHVLPGASGLTVCAVRSGAPECAVEGLHAPSGRIDYQVRLPQGVRLIARTVNGGITADSLSGDVDAATVNGSVSISTTGTAQARTVNGSIRARLLQPFWRKPQEFSAVNGGISIQIPPHARASVKAETRNGRIVSEVPDFRGSATDKTLDGSIGGGGGVHNPLVVRTLNGGIELRQRF
jgi:hypothetical protein